MSRPLAIPDNLVTVLMQKANDGWTAIRISEWLKLEYDLDASISTVQKRVKEFKKLEQDAKRSAIREAAAKDGVNCVDLLNHGIFILNQQALALISSNDLTEKQVGRQMAETALKYMNSKMNLVGMDKEELTESEEELLAGILKKIGE